MNAQLTVYNAALELLTDPTASKDMKRKIRKLNDSKENLEESVGKSETSSILENEIDLMLQNRQIEAFDAFSSAITARKEAL